MSEQSKKLERATIDQAKAAWEAHPDPSLRSVAAVLREVGLDCKVANLQRWHKAGWILKGKTRNEAKTSESAQAEVAMGVKKQDDATLTRIEAIQAEEAAMKARAEELGKETVDAELARQAMRTSLIAQIVLSEQIIRRAVFLVETKPEDVAKLIEKLKGPAASTTIVMPTEQPAENGNGARVVNGRVIEKSPTQLAIESFEARMAREGIAA